MWYGMKNILVYFATDDFGSYIQELLKDSYALFVTKDKTELPGMARAHYPSLVFVENTGVDTVNIIELLRSIEHFKAVPFLCLIERDKYTKFSTLFNYAHVDVIEKPLFEPALINRINNYTEYHKPPINISDMMNTSEFAITQTILLDFIDAASDYRNTEPQGHVTRMQNYAKALSIELQKSEKYQGAITDKDVTSLFLAAPLHDIGKAAVPEEILLKKGPLEPDEYEIVKTHTTAGFDALKRVESKLHNSSFLKFASDIVYCHHERWDGKGYPRGLKREEISIFSRIMGLVDVYDALISQTLYRPAFSHAQAVEIITEERGNHFCPDVADAFLEIHEDFKTIAIMNADSMVEIDVLNS